MLTNFRKKKKIIKKKLCPMPHWMNWHIVSFVNKDRIFLRYTTNYCLPENIKTGITQNTDQVLKNFYLKWQTTFRCSKIWFGSHLPLDETKWMRLFSKRERPLYGSEKSSHRAEEIFFSNIKRVVLSCPIVWSISYKFHRTNGSHALYAPGHGKLLPQIHIYIEGRYFTVVVDDCRTYFDELSALTYTRVQIKSTQIVINLNLLSLHAEIPLMYRKDNLDHSYPHHVSSLSW